MSNANYRYQPHPYLINQLRPKRSVPQWLLEANRGAGTGWGCDSMTVRPVQTRPRSELPSTSRSTHD